MSASTLMAPLMARQFCKLQGPPFHPTPSTGVPQCLASRPVTTPLQPEAWRQALAKHPNLAWVAALVQGIQQGFLIGLQESILLPGSTLSVQTTPNQHPFSS